MATARRPRPDGADGNRGEHAMRSRARDRIGTALSASAAAPALVLSVVLSAQPAQAQTSAQGVPDQLAIIYREANASERDTIEDIAKRLYPDRHDEIDDVIDAIEDEEKAAADVAGFLKSWEGEGSFGASLDTGNTEEWGAYAGAELTRRNNLWEHRFSADFNLREVDGERTEERLNGAYRARRDFRDSPVFAFGSLAYARNPFQGIGRRFTEVVGAGYQIVDTGAVDWEASGGPAMRQTRFTGGTAENRLAVFLDTDFSWDITDTLAFSEQVTLVLDEANTTLTTSTAVTSDLYGNLSARLSFGTIYESDPAPGATGWDTSTRLSVVLGL